MNSTKVPSIFSSVYYCYNFVFFFSFSFLALYGKYLPGHDHCCQIKVYKISCEHTRTSANSWPRMFVLLKLDKFVSQLLIVCLRQNFVCDLYGSWYTIGSNMKVAEAI